MSSAKVQVPQVLNLECAAILSFLAFDENKAIVKGSIQITVGVGVVYCQTRTFQSNFRAALNSDKVGTLLGTTYKNLMLDMDRRFFRNTNGGQD